MKDQYTEFVIRDDEIFPRGLPSHIKVIDDVPRLIRVDLKGMKLPTTGGLETTLRLSDIDAHLAPATAQIYYAVVLHALDGNRKVGTVLQWCSRFERMLRDLQLPAKVASVTLKLYLTAAKSSSPNDLKTLRSFLKYWIRLRHPGIREDLKVYLQTSRSPKPASPIEIQARKDHERPFSYEQVRAIHRCVDDLYIAGTFSPQDNLLWRLMISEALRPAQIQLLRVKDVSVASGDWRSTMLDVPMVKLHGKPARSHMISVLVSESVAVALRDHLSWLQGLLGHAPSPDQPLFSVNQAERREFVQTRPLGINSLIARKRRHIVKHVIDLRDIDLFARRFKHTKLTHLAILGAPLEVLMHAAFHSSSGSLTRYINLTDEMADEYERRMEPHFTLVLDAFRGEVVGAKDKQAISEENRILSSDLEDELGGCATKPCGALAPDGCYVCPRFRPFEDGPHDQVLRAMEAKRRDRVEMNLPPETIRRDDELISAVKRVIAICEERVQRPS